MGEANLGNQSRGNSIADGSGQQSGANQPLTSGQKWAAYMANPPQGTWAFTERRELEESNEDLPALLPGQQRAIAALLKQPSRADAAKAAGVPLPTLLGWFATDASFDAQYRIARREKFAKSMSLLHERAGQMTQTLLVIVHDPKAATRTRLSASRTLMQHALDAADKSHVSELAEKVESTVVFEERWQQAHASSRISHPVRPFHHPLTPKQERALLAAVECATQLEAARTAGVGLRTLQLWLTKHAVFRTSYENARREYLERIRLRIEEALPTLVECIYQIATDTGTKGCQQVAAARLLVQFSARGKSLIARAERLETTLEAANAAQRQRDAA